MYASCNAKETLYDKLAHWSNGLLMASDWQILTRDSIANQSASFLCLWPPIASQNSGDALSRDPEFAGLICN